MRKTLQAVESIGGYLVSDGIKILGVTMEKPDNCLSVQFQGKLGFLKYNNELIASISNAGYCNNTLKAKLVEIEYLLLDYPINTEQRSELFKTVEYIVHNSQERAFGACVILDLAQETTKISGQNLSPTISLTNQTNKELACALSKVDGAIHITADLELQAFACLLDGGRIEGENAARGARYNSALRFTHHNPDCIVVVVSSDRPVSVIYRGKEVFLDNYINGEKICMLAPQDIFSWLESVS